MDTMAADVAWALAWLGCALVGVGLHLGVFLLARQDWRAFAGALPARDPRRLVVRGMLRTACVGVAAKAAFAAVAVLALGARADWWAPAPELVSAGMIAGLLLLDLHTAAVARGRWRLRYAAPVPDGA